MAENPNLGAVTEALSRAHTAARHGSLDAQTGAISEQAAYVRAILVCAHDACRSWSNWEAINDRLAAGGDTIQALEWLDLGAIQDVRKSLARDAILGAFRLSDPCDKDRLTLCRLALWLEDDAVAARLSGREWAIDLGYQPGMADDAATSNAARIDRIRSHVVSQWKPKPPAKPPANPELHGLRECLRPTRNHLAHATESASISPPTVDQFRRILDLTLDLATDAAFVWLGSAVSADVIRAFNRNRATKFWNHAFAEPIAVWSKDMAQRCRDGIEHG